MVVLLLPCGACKEVEAEGGKDCVQCQVPR